MSGTFDSEGVLSCGACKRRLLAGPIEIKDFYHGELSVTCRCGVVAFYMSKG